MSSNPQPTHQATCFGLCLLGGRGACSNLLMYVCSAPADVDPLQPTNEQPRQETLNSFPSVLASWVFARSFLPFSIMYLRTVPWNSTHPNCWSHFGLDWEVAGLGGTCLFSPHASRWVWQAGHWCYAHWPFLGTALYKLLEEYSCYSFLISFPLKLHGWLGKYMFFKTSEFQTLENSLRENWSAC